MAHHYKQTALASPNRTSGQEFDEVKWTGTANPKNGIAGSDIYNDSEKFGDVINRPVINGVTQATFTKRDPATGKPIQRYYGSEKENGRRLGTGDSRVAALIGASHPGYNDVVNDGLTKWAGPEGIIPTYGAKFADMAATGLARIHDLPAQLDAGYDVIGPDTPENIAKIIRQNKKFDAIKPTRYDRGFANLVMGSITTPVQIGYAATQDVNASTNSDPVRRQASAQSADTVVKGMIGSIAQAPNLDPNDPRSQRGWFMQMMRAEDLAKQGDHAGALVALQNSGNAIKKAIKDDPINAGATLAGIGLFGLKGFHDIPANYGELSSTLQRGSALASKLGAPDVAATMRHAAAKTAVKSGLISIGRTSLPPVRPTESAPGIRREASIENYPPPTPKRTWNGPRTEKPIAGGDFTTKTPDLQSNPTEATREAPANAGASSALRGNGAKGNPLKTAMPWQQDAAGFQAAGQKVRQGQHEAALDAFAKTLDNSPTPWFVDPDGVVRNATGQQSSLGKVRGALGELVNAKTGEFWRNEQAEAAARGDWKTANTANYMAEQAELKADNHRSTRLQPGDTGGSSGPAIGTPNRVNKGGGTFLDKVGQNADQARTRALEIHPADENGLRGYAKGEQPTQLDVLAALDAGAKRRLGGKLYANPLIDPAVWRDLGIRLAYQLTDYYSGRPLAPKTIDEAFKKAITQDYLDYKDRILHMAGAVYDSLKAHPADQVPGQPGVLKQSVFGREYSTLNGRPKDAERHLYLMGAGAIPEALNIPGIGNVALYSGWEPPFGNEESGAGFLKILRKHPEFIGNIDEKLRELTRSTLEPVSNPPKYRIESPYRDNKNYAIINQGYDGDPRYWLNTIVSPRKLMPLRGVHPKASLWEVPHDDLYMDNIVSLLGDNLEKPTFAFKKATPADIALLKQMDYEARDRMGKYNQYRIDAAVSAANRRRRDGW